MTRQTEITAFLAQHGWGQARRQPLTGDASTRRYERLADGKRQAILMDAPLKSESLPCPPGASEAERMKLGWNATSRLAASRVEAFAAVAEHLRGMGLSAPEILAVDVAQGLALVEDLGDALYSQVIGKSADECLLYEAAAEILAALHQRPVPTQLPAPDGSTWPLLDYDALALKVNADLFLEWLPKVATDIRADGRMQARFESLRDDLIAEALTFPRAFTIRDYHADNLIWLPERKSLARVGLLDIQDAVRGWRAWDFSMLLHDARRDVTPAAAQAALHRYLATTGAAEAPFRQELAILGAINVMRILGIFARLVARDGKARYLDFMPRMWGHLGTLLSHPALKGLAAFMTDIAKAHLKAVA